MQNPNMAEFNAAKVEVDDMMNYISTILYGAVNGDVLRPSELAASRAAAETALAAPAATNSRALSSASIRNKRVLADPLSTPKKSGGCSAEGSDGTKSYPPLQNSPRQTQWKGQKDGKENFEQTGR